METRVLSLEEIPAEWIKIPATATLEDRFLQAYASSDHHAITWVLDVAMPEPTATTSIMEREKLAHAIGAIEGVVWDNLHRKSSPITAWIEVKKCAAGWGIEF